MDGGVLWNQSLLPRNSSYNLGNLEVPFYLRAFLGSTALTKFNGALRKIKGLFLQWPYRLYGLWNSILLKSRLEAPYSLQHHWPYRYHVCCFGDTSPLYY